MGGLLLAALLVVAQHWQQPPPPPLEHHSPPPPRLECALAIISPLPDSMHEPGRISVKIGFSAADQSTVQSAFGQATMWMAIDGRAQTFSFATAVDEPLELQSMTAGPHELQMAVHHTNSAAPFCNQPELAVHFSVMPFPAAALPDVTDAPAESRRTLWYTPRTGGTFNQLDS